MNERHNDEMASTECIIQPFPVKDVICVLLRTSNRVGLRNRMIPRQKTENFGDEGGIHMQGVCSKARRVHLGSTRHAWGCYVIVLCVQQWQMSPKSHTAMHTIATQTHTQKDVGMPI